MLRFRVRGILYVVRVNANELSARIQDKYRVELTDFRKKLLGREGRSGVHNQNDPDRRIPGLGPVRSLEDSRVDLTIGADASDLDWFAEDPSLEGSCITVSIAGHHRLMGTRASLSSGECDAWVQAILGLSWTDHIYRAGTLSGVAGRLSTVYYRLFLDEGMNPRERPESFQDKGLRPLRDL